MIAGFVVMFILMAAAERAVSAELRESSVFCLSVTASTQDMLEIPWEERIIALSNLKETDPELASHVIPATGAATRAWIRGVTKERILQGVYLSCMQQMQNA